MIRTPIPERTKGQTHVLQFAAEPISTVRIGFIGLGIRATRAIKRYMFLDGAEIKAICDVSEGSINRIGKIIAENHRPAPLTFSGTEGWKQVCEHPEIDLIYICTDWESHTPMAIYGMQCGKHVAVEVPAATTIDECWQLVDTAEQTRRHCMMLENACYDFFELTTLNMARKGIFGEIIHAEGAYIHDIRSLIFAHEESGNYKSNWQLNYCLKHTGNPYPTHGLGPICQAMNIHRGDRMTRIVSMSTNQWGLTEYAINKYGKDSQEAFIEYATGDVNTSIIRTELGKTIMLQHNRANPRPYSRIHLLNGTKGYTQKYPSVQMAFDSEHPLTNEEIELLLKEYEHPFVTELGKKAIEVADIRARDFIMDYRLIYCLRNGLPLDQDVYDAAEWSCIVELSEKSVLNGSEPVEIPDFTRGLWNGQLTIDN